MVIRLTLEKVCSTSNWFENGITSLSEEIFVKEENAFYNPVQLNVLKRVLQKECIDCLTMM